MLRGHTVSPTSSQGHKRHRRSGGGPARDQSRTQRVTGRIRGYRRHATSVAPTPVIYVAPAWLTAGCRVNEIFVAGHAAVPFFIPPGVHSR